MTEEIKKKAKEYELETRDMGTEELQEAYNAGFSDGYEIGKKNERKLQCGKKYIESLGQRIHLLETENASFREENKKLRQQFFELKSKIVDLIYNDENCLDKTIELLDDFECELEEDEE